MSDPFAAFESALGTESLPSSNQFEIDPAAEFLAREQAEFAKIENNNLISDNFGDFSSVTNSAQQAPVLSSGFEEEEDPFGIASSSSETTNVTAHIESLNLNSEPKQNLASISPNSDKDWVLVDKADNNSNPTDVYSAISSVDRLSNEPEKLKVWREEQKTRLQNKDAEEEVKKKEWKEAAKRELEEWYKNRKEQLQKTHENNKAAEADLVGPRDTQPGQEWDKLAKLCDFNPKANKNTRDVSRMRSILLHLKQQPLIR